MYWRPASFPFFSLSNSIAINPNKANKNTRMTSNYDVVAGGRGLLLSIHPRFRDSLDAVRHGLCQAHLAALLAPGEVEYRDEEERVPDASLAWLYTSCIGGILVLTRYLRDQRMHCTTRRRRPACQRRRPPSVSPQQPWWRRCWWRSPGRPGTESTGPE